MATAAGLVLVLVVLLWAFARVRVTPLRAFFVRVVVAAVLSLVAEPEATALRSGSLMALLREEDFLSLPEFEAAARRDAGSAAATDGLSEQSVFGRGAGIGFPSASPPLELAPTTTAACRILAVRSRVLGDGATFQCTTLHCNDADRARGAATQGFLPEAPLCGGCRGTDDAGVVAQRSGHHRGPALQQG